MNLTTCNRIAEELIPNIRALPCHDDCEDGSVALDDVIVQVGEFYTQCVEEKLTELRDIFVAARDQIDTGCY